MQHFDLQANDSKVADDLEVVDSVVGGSEVDDSEARWSAVVDTRMGFG